MARLFLDSDTRILLICTEESEQACIQDFLGTKSFIWHGHRFLIYKKGYYPLPRSTHMATLKFTLIHACVNTV